MRFYYARGTVDDEKVPEGLLVVVVFHIIIDCHSKKKPKPKQKEQKKRRELIHNILKPDLQKFNELLPSVDLNPTLNQREKWTPLHFACHKNRPDFVKALLLNGANPNIQGYQKKYTPLHKSKIKNKLLFFCLCLGSLR